MEMTSVYQSLIVVCLICLVTLALIFLCDARRNAVLETLKLSGPKSLSYIGNLIASGRSGSLHNLQLEHMKKYGKIFTWSLDRYPDIVVAEPEMLRQILNVQFPKFRKKTRGSIDGQQYLLNDMRFEATDETVWSRNRSAMALVYCRGNILKVVPLLDEAIETFFQKVHEVVNTGININILQWFEQLTIDIFFLTFFGLRSDVQTNPNSDVYQMCKRFMGEQDSCSLIDKLPFGTWVKSVFGRVDSNSGLFTKFLSRIINYRCEQHLQVGNETVDFLDMMLNPDGGLGLNNNQIMTQSLVSMLHGYQASSNTLAFVAYHLATHREIQEQLRTEIEETLQDSSEATMVDSNIEYLECVINECQRLHPSCCVITRTCAAPCTIHDIHFNTGFQVAVPVYALHHDPEAWDNADGFDPERFRGPAVHSRHPYQFLPFGAGPRKCIGSKLALLAINRTLVKILRKFVFVRSQETEVPLTVKTASDRLTAKHGIFLKIEMVQ